MSDRERMLREIAEALEVLTGVGARHAVPLLLVLADLHWSDTSTIEMLSLLARRQSAKLFELRATVSLSRLWQAQGKRQEAQQMLAVIYGWFTEGFDTADLQEANTVSS